MPKKVTMNSWTQSKFVKILLWIFFSIYLIILIKLIVLKYPSHMLRDILSDWNPGTIWEGIRYRSNFIPLDTIRLYIRAYQHHTVNVSSIAENLVGNVVAFLPFGFVLPMVSRHPSLIRTMLIAFGFVLGIELFQLITSFGAFDVDDILLNLLGTLFGYLIYLAVMRHNRKYNI